MVQIAHHGGGCCGARHIYTFRNEDAVEEDIRDLKNLVRDQENHTLLEINLSNLQTRNKPLLITALVELGFVYTSCWVGNHGTDVHRFERTGNRKALQANGFDWQGMYASSTLSGGLPDITTAGAAGAVNRRRDGSRSADYNNTGTDGPMIANRAYVGDYVSVINLNSNNYGDTLRVEAVENDHFRFEGRIRLRRTSVLRTAPPENAAQLLFPPAGQQVHANADVVARAAVEIARPVEVVEPDVTVVFSTFHNNYRATGRGAGYDTRAEAAAAAPRCRRIDRRDILSDRTVNWVSNV